MAEPLPHLTYRERPGGLRRPVLLLAFGGWNDAAEAATNTVRFLRSAWNGSPYATLDGEEFYHFGLSRPLVRFVPGTSEREIVWPDTEFSHCRAAGLARDVLIGVGTEPHLRWKTYCATVLEMARELEVGLIVTLGALLAEVPHTRPIRLTGFATDPELGTILGVKPTRYEGPTGIVGVLSSAARAAGFATASLWANVPHYVAGVENPKATLALLHRVNRLFDGPLDLGELEEAAKQFDAQLAQVLAQNRKVASYVRKLEVKDAETEVPQPEPPGELPPSQDLVAEIERFLRQQRPGPDPE
jgi:proteasome assembly chaperone (PAC2) family protein